VSAPWGRIVVALDGDGRLVSIDLTGSVPDAGRRDQRRSAEAKRQLEQYFAGKRREFSLPLVLDGTPFRRRVWQALSAIPYGTVITYGELAARINAPGAARAVGQANGANPLPIVVPCHRVVASGGRLGGFTSGTDIKCRLLDLERVDLAA
jgi:methylated-DNA-[protein]-cysteine S-methyltransferase